MPSYTPSAVQCNRFVGPLLRGLFLAISESTHSTTEPVTTPLLRVRGIGS